jgi:hypothetical protein
VDLKEAVAEHLIATLRPLRERRAMLAPAFAHGVLEQGAARARDVARSTLAEARDRIGILRVGSVRPALDRE